MAIKNIVAQHKSTRTARDKFLSHQERLRDSFWLRLNLILQLDSELTTISQQGLKFRNILGRSYKKDVANACQHQRGKRVIDHRFVVNRKQTLPHGVSYGIQASSRSSRQDDALIANVRRSLLHRNLSS